MTISGKKVPARRGRLRRQALRPPNPRSADFRREAHEQSLAVAQSPLAQEDQGFINAVADSLDTDAWHDA